MTFQIALGIIMFALLAIMVYMSIVVIKLRKAVERDKQGYKKCYNCGHRVVYANPKKPHTYTCPKCDHTWESKY